MENKLTNPGFPLGKHILKFMIRTLLFFYCLSVFSLAPGDVISQNSRIKIDEDKTITIDEIFYLIMNQTDYKFIYEENIFEDLPKVHLKKGVISTSKLLNISLAKANLNVVLTKDNTILIKEANSQQQITVSGKVTDQSGVPVVGATVLIKGTTKGTATDFDGAFSIAVPNPENALVFSALGLKTLEVTVGSQKTINVIMTEEISELGEVTLVSTGFQELPKERATGSFVQIDNKLFNRTVSTDIITRLENIVPGLLFDKRQVSDSRGEDIRSLRIRGINSIESDNSPLIVVDNFPFEGDINTINPNDVESITVLRDAASASIWGARAANGVIVITMKKGQWNQPLSVSFNNNVTIGATPDLHYSPDFITSKNYIELEQTLFDRGFYNSDLNSSRYPAISPVVELLAQERDGLISTSELNQELTRLAQYDVRNEAEKYFYRNSLKQQTSLSLRGGSQKAEYYLSGGLDRNLANRDGDELNRITLVSNQTFRPVEGLELRLGINITNQKQKSNGSSWGSIGTELPYNRFADDSGQWLPVTNELRSTYLDEAEANGLLDWQYRPLQEKALRDIVTRTTDYRIDMGVGYNFLNYFNIDLKYQYQRSDSKLRNRQDKDSYLTRHQVNRFTQADGTRVFPYGDVLAQRYNQQIAHSGRVQLNYNQRFNSEHRVDALIGMEVREVHATQSGFKLFGYDDNVLTFNNELDFTTRFPLRPAGSSYLPSASESTADLTDRYLSYFGNASYSFKNRYVISGSARYDASNLFGVKANQKGVPLWSLGGSWDVSKELFYNSEILPYLRIRTTYGYNGNVNKSATAFPTGRYTVDSNRTNLPVIVLRSPGNPQLKWEKVGMLNLGLDFGFKNQRITGSVEYFNKLGSDIIGEVPLDPTAGQDLGNLANNVNYAKTKTYGMDFEINTINIDQAFQWTSTILFSWTKNKILEFNSESITTNNILAGTTNNFSNLPQQGRPIDGVYSLPWQGLDPNTGDPILVVDGQPSNDYRDYVRGLTYEDLIYHGVNVAPVYGAIRNNFSWKNFTLSANISWKANYYFRKSSLGYDGLFNDLQVHSDYANRWQQPGDELITQVPSMPESSDFYRDFMYQGSELHVEKGDHIRLEDINLSYTLSKNAQPRLPFRELRVFANARNLGILWQASKTGLDPDYPNTTYLIPKIYSIGVNVTF
ncbi:SusC/RagA family TonB-linked outer membrane protein [Confluentibacter sediminis]|uniref:SusC/RagA family TonB-linked outer membrane protein n=1 Tax=Confluentibacter sediminis TaxID=2219045 RepID=UPI000DAE2271|nr:SusC/RagA family TonB-linked outer membrane protein [Confluentibacter sediminis]